MSHFIERCQNCGIVINQCRCPSKDKEERWSLCEDCKSSDKETGEEHGKK